MIRPVNLIVIHCSATPENTDYPPEQLSEDHAARGFWKPFGYHFYYTKDGVEHVGRSLNVAGAHVKGHNKTTVGLAYEGGLDKNKKPADTRTAQQKEAITKRISELRKKYGNIPVVGHRDLSPDKNGDGTIQANERLKECPCYEAIDEHNDTSTLKPFLILHYNK